MNRTGLRAPRHAPALALAMLAAAWVASPGPAHAQTRTLPLTPVERLGKALFFDTTMSNPVGMSCATCHDPAAGFTAPKSEINLTMGPVEGAVKGRFGKRKPNSITYSVFSPIGPYYDPDVQTMVGGVFWDGRAEDLVAQVKKPTVDPNEMNNIVHNLASPALIAQKVKAGPNAALFRQVFGPTALARPADEVFNLVAGAIAFYEASPEVCQFSSKYDAFLEGKAALTPSELNGLRLATGSTTGRPAGPPHVKNAQCFQCHGIADDPGDGPDLWSLYCFVNLGVPRNAKNPFYKQVDARSNPLGCNLLGEGFVDLGIGASFYPASGLPPGNFGPGADGRGDLLAINGSFRAQTLRNTDKRPDAHFVKSYMHNGVFKSLKQVVHFYNTRNLTTFPGEVINFAAPNPYAGLRGAPLWPAPEFPSTVTLQNPSGAPGSPSAQVGNLGLTDREEDDIVNFLKTLSDGYYTPGAAAQNLGRRALVDAAAKGAPMSRGAFRPSMRGGD